MHEEKRTFRLFIIGWALLFAVGACFAWQGDKLAIHAAMNGLHAPALDAFFARFTHLADGLVPTGLAFLLLFVKSWRAFLMMGLSCGLSAIAVQTLKRGPYSQLDRPWMFRDQLVGMPWVEGIDLHAHFSFPSGHATAAFSMCLALAIMVGRPWAGVLLALFAGLLGSTRIYLSQHFLQDVILGAVLGTVCAWYAYRLCYIGPLSTKPWIDRRPIGRQNQ